MFCCSMMRLIVSTSIAKLLIDLNEDIHHDGLAAPHLPSSEIVALFCSTLPTVPRFFGNFLISEVSFVILSGASMRASLSCR